MNEVMQYQAELRRLADDLSESWQHLRRLSELVDHLERMEVALWPR